MKIEKRDISNPNKLDGYYIVDESDLYINTLSVIKREAKTILDEVLALRHEKEENKISGLYSEYKLLTSVKKEIEDKIFIYRYYIKIGSKIDFEKNEN